MFSLFVTYMLKTNLVKLPQIFKYVGMLYYVENVQLKGSKITLNMRKLNFIIIVSIIAFFILWVEKAHILFGLNFCFDVILNSAVIINQFRFFFASYLYLEKFSYSFVQLYILISAG